MRSPIVIALALAHLALAPLVHAQEAADAEPAGFDTLVARAMQHYSAREYEPAIELFQQAYEVRAEPELVYNIARSYERLARGEEALREYERFVALPGTTSELRSRAFASIQALREEQRQREAATRDAQPPPPPEPVVAEPAPPPAAPSRVSSGGGDGIAVGGWILFGVGAAAVAVGAGLGGLAIVRNDAFEQETSFERKLELRDEVRTYALATDFLLIGGGAVALTGLILGIVGATSGGSSDVGVLVGPGLAGVTLDGRF